LQQSKINVATLVDESSDVKKLLINGEQ